MKYTGEFVLQSVAKGHMSDVVQEASRTDNLG